MDQHFHMKMNKVNMNIYNKTQGSKESSTLGLKNMSVGDFLFLLVFSCFPL